MPTSNKPNETDHDSPDGIDVQVEFATKGDDEMYRGEGVLTYAEGGRHGGDWDGTLNVKTGDAFVSIRLDVKAIADLMRTLEDGGDPPERLTELPEEIDDE